MLSCVFFVHVTSDSVIHGKFILHWAESIAHHDGRVIDDPSQRYGSGGVEKGKKFMLSVTLNAPKYAFDTNEFFEGKGVDGLFMWLHKVYQFNGFDSLPGFAAYDVIKNPTIEQDFANFDKHISQLFA
ncbi:NAD(P)H-dependent oxidoreductase [Pseudomonas aeruginosa]|nr:NAD(P)H-dependent oxidoreductase [Pseudomonas aeruginosa]MCD2845362.1 NAD(P)H-dependent oxidoreductase [Pseudomonas aeruginosa]MCD2865389.1 NAD(P)H-dependent oxidoreductase [Pseudomonas aeruginosa]